MRPTEFSKIVSNIEVVVLKEMYVSKGMTALTIAEHFGVPYHYIVRKLSKSGIRVGGSRKEKDLPIDEVILLATEGGVSLADIAEKYGFTTNGIRNKLKKRGFRMPTPVKTPKAVKVSRRVHIPKEDLEKMFIEDKLSDMEISRRVGVCNITVANWRRKHGIKRDHPVNFIPLPAEELKRLYIDEKWNMSQIADHFKCGISTVRNHIISHNLNIDSLEVALRKLAKNKEKYTYRSICSGYRMFKADGHPTANREGYVHEHRYVAECAMGRCLVFGEEVHHIGVMDKLDNSVENLATLTSGQHSLVHKYMERVGAYLAGLTSIKVAPLKFDPPAFWAGQWISSLDLLDGIEPRPKIIGKMTIAEAPPLPSDAIPFPLTPVSVPV